MGTFYFAGSLNERADFVVGTFVFAKADVNKHVARAFREAGLIPGDDVFRPWIIGQGSPIMAEVRQSLREILRDHCQIGAVILPADDQIRLGDESLKALAVFLQKNGLWSERHSAYFDTNVFSSPDTALELAREYPPLRSCRFHFEQSARKVPGLQLAQLAAHSCALLLLEALELAKSSGGSEVIRHSFFSGGITRNTGLYFSPDCGENLRFLAENYLTSRQLGALH